MEAEAAKAAKKEAPIAANALSAFGFVSSAIKAAKEDKTKLFQPFVQDRRIVPKALQFWKNDEDENHAQSTIDEASVNILACFTNVDKCFHGEEESSLLHPPLCEENSRAAKPKFSTFGAMIEASNNCNPASGAEALSLLCPCKYHTSIHGPYKEFDSEVIFCAFKAIGYEPCQSRPPYFGTFNNVHEGFITKVELFRMARFALGADIPRLSSVDYEYDSGDDWDVLDDDEDVATTSSDESNVSEDSLDSSDLDFINDDDDSDSEGDWQRKTMEAQQRRNKRLRGKDKLIPSFSGPFVGIPICDHPLGDFDQLDRIAALDYDFFSSMLAAELKKVEEKTEDEEPADATDDEERQQKLIETALRNKREMGEEELNAVHVLLSANNKLTIKNIIDALRQQKLCKHIPKAEIQRTLKRYYERKHNMYIRRAVPWDAADPRLFKDRTRGSEGKATLTEGNDNEEETPSKTEAGSAESSAEKVSPPHGATGTAQHNGDLLSFFKRPREGITEEGDVSVVE